MVKIIFPHQHPQAFILPFRTKLGIAFSRFMPNPVIFNSTLVTHKSQILKRDMQIAFFDHSFQNQPKSHPLIFTILLQQLDAARITLSDNTTHDLSNFFIVATSNIGAHTFQNIKHLSERRLQQNLEMQLKERFSPEFVARFGKFDHEILIFRPLKPEHLRLIARKFYLNLLPNYHESHQITIHGVTDDVIEETLRQIDNTRNGARELRSTVERKVRAFMYELLNRKTLSAIEGYLDTDPADPENLILISTPPQNRRTHLCR